MRATMSMPTALALFRLIYVAFIATASLTTLLQENGPGFPGHAGFSHLTILASVEIVAALLFLFRRGEIWACAILLTVYSIATAISVTLGDWTLRFVYYGATAIFIAMASRNLRADIGHQLQQR